MKRIDIMTAVCKVFAGQKFRKRELVDALDLANEKRARKLWKAMRNVGVINKTSHKDFEIVTVEKICAVA